MNIGDVLLRVIADLKEFSADLQKRATSAGDKAGLTMGQRMTRNIKSAFSKGGLQQGLMQGLGFGAGFGAVTLLDRGLSTLIGTIGDSINAASDLREANSLATQVFEDQTEAIDEWADGAAQAFGQSEREAKNFAASFGTAFKNVGFSMDETVDKSKTLTRLAADLGSAFNRSSDEAATALRSGLLGESEPLRRFGVFLSEAAVAQEAYASGIADVGDELTNQQKVQARYNIIMRQTADAQGMFGRDTESLADAQKRASAELENAQAQLGRFLIPLLAEAAMGAAGLAREVSNMAEAFAGFEIDQNSPLAQIAKTLGDIDRESAKFLDDAADMLTFWDGNTSAAEDAEVAMARAFATTVAQAKLAEHALRESGDAMTDMAADAVKAGQAIETVDPAEYARKVQAAVASLDTDLGRAVTISRAAYELGTEIPNEIVQGILDNQGKMREGMEALRLIMEQEKTPSAQVASTIGFLMGDELNSAMRDKREGTRLAAQDLWTTGAEELRKFIREGGVIGEKSMDKLIAGTRSKDKDVRNGSKRTLAIIDDEMSKLEAKTRKRGEEGGKGVADGIKNKRQLAETASERTARTIERNIKPNTKPAGNAAVNGVVGALRGGRGRVGNAAALLARTIALRMLSVIRAEARARSGVTLSGPLREHGGPVYPGQAYIVGEKRPELFVPDVPGRIVPRVPAMTDTSSWTGGTTVNVQTYGLPMYAESPAQVVRRIKRASRLGTVSPTPQAGTWERT